MEEEEEAAGEGESNDNLSSSEELARSFEFWQKEYYDTVDMRFSAQDKERGIMAAEIWENKFLKFLKEESPSLLNMYNNNVRGKSVKRYFGTSIYQSWKQGKGGVIEAFLTDAIIFARDGKLEDLYISPQNTKSSVPENEDLSNNRVFLVHGHHEGLLHETARFLEGLNLEVIILREQPNLGKTIIEKFIDYSDVAYAVVLLTGDDKGGKANENFENQKLRPRQNVILELGFFLGKLERKNVCALYQSEVEIPSDYNGVLFIELDSKGAWHYQLAREMKSSGLNIDMNDVV